MKVVKQEFALRLDSVEPSEFSVVDLANIITAIERSAREVVRYDNNLSSDYQSQDEQLSLVAVEDNCTLYRFSATMKMILALTTGTFCPQFLSSSRVGEKTMKVHRLLNHISRERSTDIHVLDSYDRTIYKVKSTDVPDEQFQGLVRFESELIGDLQEIGGPRKPKAKIKLLSGQTLDCKLDRGLAIEMGQYLFRRLVIVGAGKYEMVNDIYKDFEIAQFRPLGKELNIDEALNVLRGMVSQDVIDHPDPDKYICQLREES